MKVNRTCTLLRRARPIAITILALCCSSNLTLYAAPDTAQTAKRIEVYALAQNFWDVRPGDTLSTIVQQLLPNNPTKRETLQSDILALNPDAFINGDAELLLADKRLFLPGYMKQADSIADPRTTQVETYSWGNIKRPIK